MTLTKEWLLRAIAELEEERDATPGAVNEDATMALAAMKLALASLEAESKPRQPELSHVIYHFRDWNEGFPVERFKADYVISWMLANYPPAQPAAVSVPDDVSGPLAHAYKELTPTFMRNHIDVFERYGIYPDGSAGIQAMRIALDGMNRRAAMLQGAENAESPTTMQTAPSLDSSQKIAESPSGNSPVIPEGWVAVPVEPTEDMIVNGFESEPDESFSDENEWEAYEAMSGCQQAAHRAKLCWAAMIGAAQKLRKQ
ncbi:hypothetical protein N7E05_003464 [Enterobacter hormaechei]|uniref:hypothetical protein n=1 Tax=Enterobacter hormaechei TaxID=158836 RepID=UPI000A8136C0|nr:hypothetical protein [Enterobacter hormaechei]